MRKDRLNMYKESYNNELARRDKLNSELNIPIAMVTLLFGSITYTVGNLENGVSGFLLIITLLALVVLVVSLVIAVVFLIKSYYNYAYEFIAHSKQMEDYYNSLIEHYKNVENKEKIVEDAFEAYLINDYCKCNETNTLNNDTRSSCLHNARTAIIVALVACAISVGASNYEKVIHTTQNCINKVTTERRFTRMVKALNPQGQAPQPPPPQQPPPHPPPTRLIRDGDRPSVKR